MDQYWPLSAILYVSLLSAQGFTQCSLGIPQSAIARQTGEIRSGSFLTNLPFARASQ